MFAQELLGALHSALNHTRFPPLPIPYETWFPEHSSSFPPHCCLGVSAFLLSKGPCSERHRSGVGLVSLTVCSVLSSTRPDPARPYFYILLWLHLSETEIGPLYGTAVTLTFTISTERAPCCMRQWCCALGRACGSSWHLRRLGWGLAAQMLLGRTCSRASLVAQW